MAVGDDEGVYHMVSEPSLGVCANRSPPQKHRYGTYMHVVPRDWPVQRTRIRIIGVSEEHDG
eukprot:3692142-Pyramimonas_sp.AAC.1